MPTRDVTWRQIVNNVDCDLRLIKDADALAAVLNNWRCVLDKFAPLIGTGSVQVLLRRSITRSALQFPFLMTDGARAADSPPLAQLITVLGQRPTDEVLAASHAIMQHFMFLLAGLIGDGLATRFLLSIFPQTRADDSAQEKD